MAVKTEALRVGMRAAPKVELKAVSTVVTRVEKRVVKKVF